MRILFVGGGSIGHVAPCVAVWRAMQALAPEAEAHFVCTEREEDAAFLRNEDLSYTPLRARHLSARSPLRAGRAVLEARSLLRSWRPDVVFGKGGALCVPVTIAARLLGIPVVLHESDAVSGRANVLLSRWARVVCLGFPQTARAYEHSAKTRSQRTTHDSKLIYTGNPVRPSITHGSREEGLHLAGFSGARPVLIVLGGSQGATALNEAVTRDLASLLLHVDVLHLTGRGKSGGPSTHAGYWTGEFAHRELPHFYAAADLALSRAGAGSISELAANGIPALLVPLRGLAQDHQLANAETAAATGGCRILMQETLETGLLPAVRELASDAPLRASMAERMHAFGVPDAAERIARLVLAAGKREYEGSRTERQKV